MHKNVESLGLITIQICHITELSAMRHCASAWHPVTRCTL